MDTDAETPLHRLTVVFDIEGDHAYARGVEEILLSDNVPVAPTFTSIERVYRSAPGGEAEPEYGYDKGLPAHFCREGAAACDFHLSLDGDDVACGLPYDHPNHIDTPAHHRAVAHG